jgi:pimeloyl-ACP methyl ester carboxylesterase
MSAAVVPRGPVTGAQVIVLIAVATVVGALAGWCIRTRWAVLAAPALHVAVWEIARATMFRLDGPTFGRPRVDVTISVLLILAVHGMYVLVAGLPMLVGVIGGRAWRHRAARAAAIWSAVVVLAVAALGDALVRPEFTHPVPGGVATVTKVRLGGADQWVSFRGDSASNPVLLHLSGGPGSSDVGWVRTFNQPLERHFTVAVWEQRGAGKSYPAVDPTSDLSLDRLVADGIELASWLARRFDESKIYLTGNSWGSTLGVLMVQRRPNLFHAFVGTGQMVDQHATDRILYRQLNSYAVRIGDQGLQRKLSALGEPPYRDVLGYALVMQYYDVIEPYDHVPAFDAARGLSGFFPEFTDSGHNADAEEPDRYNDLLVTTVLAETYGR